MTVCRVYKVSSGVFCQYMLDTSVITQACVMSMKLSCVYHTVCSVCVDIDVSHAVSYVKQRFVQSLGITRCFTRCASCITRCASRCMTRCESMCMTHMHLIRQSSIFDTHAHMHLIRHSSIFDTRMCKPVIAQSTAFDPAAMEAKVAENMAEIKDIIAETGEESKMLAKFVKPVSPSPSNLHSLFVARARARTLSLFVHLSLSLSVLHASCLFLARARAFPLSVFPFLSLFLSLSLSFFLFLSFSIFPPTLSLSRAPTWSSRCPLIHPILVVHSDSVTACDSSYHPQAAYPLWSWSDKRTINVIGLVRTCRVGR